MADAGAGCATLRSRRLGRSIRHRPLRGWSEPADADDDGASGPRRQRLLHRLFRTQTSCSLLAAVVVAVECAECPVSLRRYLQSLRYTGVAGIGGGGAGGIGR